MTDSNSQPEATPGRIAISGASGLVGAALVEYFEAAGRVVVPMVRQAVSSASNAPDAVAWDIESGAIEAAKLEGVDAVVHLAGEQVVGRWTRAKRRRIERSRVVGTELISRTLAKLKDPPKVMLCASAIAIYGDRGDRY
jgi:NAD dependent epimerase/dehydratase family enzyme